MPYKLLYPFFDKEGMEEGLSYIKNDKHSHLIAYMAQLSGDENLLYTILDGVGLQKKIRINPYWRKFLLENYMLFKVGYNTTKLSFFRIEILGTRHHRQDMSGE